MRRRPRKFVLAAVLVVLALLAAACGSATDDEAAGDGDASETSTEETSSEQSAGDDDTGDDADVEDSQDPGEVVFVSWGGAYQEAQTNAFLDPFVEESGVEVIQDEPVDYAKLIAMVEAGDVTWDVVDVESDFGIGSSTEFLEPIDYSIVPQDAIIEGQATEYRVGNIFYGMVIGFNTDTFGDDGPKSWADFFDTEKFPGTRMLPRTANKYAFEVALIADGVAPEDLYPLDYERAITVLDRIKDDVVFWESGSQSAQIMADGEAEIGMLWNGRLQTAMDEGAPLGIEWNQHIALFDYLVVPKGSPNVDEAMQLIAYMLSDDNAHRISEFISYAPTNVNTFDKVAPENADVLASFEDRPASGFVVDDIWWDANKAEAVEAYDSWLLDL